VVERFLLAFLARARGSRGGTLLIIVGVLILFVFLVFGLVSVAGDVAFMLTGAGPVMQFVATGPGILTGFAVAVVVILLGVAFLTHATPQSTSSTVHRVSGTSQAERERELEQLQKSFRRIQQERDRLRSRLSDPTAVRRLEDERLRRRCLEVAHELQNFMRRGGHIDRNELVARFQQRHEWKVNELRNRLDEQAWLTPQERDTLTFRADDYSHKIDDMVTTLKDIGMGR
jgi:hypothetical protein